MRKYDKEEQLVVFISYTDRQPSGCWIWTKSLKEGYGQYKNGYAHRWIWEYLNGPVPYGLVVMHNCDNKVCVNPDHLVVGTQKENIQDAVSKGRIANGERQGLSKLTEADVREARLLYKTGRVTQPQLAQMYGVCQATIYEMLTYKTWAHVKEEA